MKINVENLLAELKKVPTPYIGDSLKDSERMRKSIVEHFTQCGYEVKNITYDEKTKTYSIDCISPATTESIRI